MSFNYSQATSTRLTYIFRRKVHDCASLQMQYQTSCLKLSVRMRKKDEGACVALHMRDGGTFQFLISYPNRKFQAGSLKLHQQRCTIMQFPSKCIINSGGYRLAIIKKHRFSFGLSLLRPLLP